MSRGCLKSDLSLSFLSNIATFSFVVLYIMSHLHKSVRLSSILRQFKCCNMSPTLDFFRCLLVTNLATKYLGLANGIISKSKRHFYNVSPKANKTMGFLRQNLNISYITEKEQAYRFLIR
jgi:hypothetical protein